MPKSRKKVTSELPPYQDLASFKTLEATLLGYCGDPAKELIRAFGELAKDVKRCESSVWQKRIDKEMEGLGLWTDEEALYVLRDQIWSPRVEYFRSIVVVDSIRETFDYLVTIIEREYKRGPFDTNMCLVSRTLGDIEDLLCADLRRAERNWRRRLFSMVDDYLVAE